MGREANSAQSCDDGMIAITCSVWDPHTNMNTQRLESVQRCAAMFCLNNFSSYSSVTSMLQFLDLPSLKSRRNITKLIIMHKIINGNLHIPSNSLIPNQRDSRNGYFSRLQTRIDSYKYSFSPLLISCEFFSPL